MTHPLPPDQWPDDEHDDLAEHNAVELPTDDLDALADALQRELDEDVDEFANEPRPEPSIATTDAKSPDFFEAGVDFHALDDLTLEGRPPVLERLGPAHFRSKGFSFMGFLQTVYDHVAEEVKGRPPTNPETP